MLVAKKIVEKEKEIGELKIDAFVCLFWNVKLLFLRCMRWMLDLSGSISLNALLFYRFVFGC